MENQNNLTEIYILGFLLENNLRMVSIVGFSVIYIITTASNAVIIFVISEEQCLHTPMYFYLVHFSFLEICYVSVIFPTMLKVLLAHLTAVSFSSCMIQLYLFLSLASTENFLLASMAVDRYVAICHPLRYSAIMNNRMLLRTVYCSWILGFAAPIIPVLMLSQVLFCGSLTIDHFFCDLAPLLGLSCNDNGNVRLVSSLFASAVLLSSFTLIILSYICITYTVCKKSTSQNLQKTFATCSSHLIVVLTFYVSGIFSYVFLIACPSFNLQKEISIIYTVGTPLVNPFIYTLRNKPVKLALRKQFLTPKPTIQKV
ncbi:hypothetical protein XELAEV_18010430mg [Xenopus laevis]|uniref:Olfactory receptor n=1 Tax=Xenopus laevis TaxID=8355 RepID=A0A974DVD1_XENLA|nr:hypothetical protein XELAEV_18010430mg [Xenopus laevis]